MWETEYNKVSSFRETHEIPIIFLQLAVFKLRLCIFTEGQAMAGSLQLCCVSYRVDAFEPHTFEKKLAFQQLRIKKPFLFPFR